MCGRLNVTDDPFVQELLKTLGVSGQNIRFSADVAPGACVSIIRETGGRRVVADAVWWLLLHKENLQPNYQYASFNSRSDKLNQTGSLAYLPYRSGRCVIPASGFVEGLGDKKSYFHLRSKHSAIAFGGLYKEWLNKGTGELVYSASIITLPPHEKLAHIHPKSMPLMLPWHDVATMNLWLDPEVNQVEVFSDLLVPRLSEQLVVTPVDRPSRRNPIGDAFVIEVDAV